MSSTSITDDALPPWMNAPIPARPVTRPASVVIPCDSPEHADRLARLLREMTSVPADSSFSPAGHARHVLFSACAKAEVQR